MTPLAQQLEAIRLKQQPVTSEVFWAQVEAFKDTVEEQIPTSHPSPSAVDLRRCFRRGSDWDMVLRG